MPHGAPALVGGAGRLGVMGTNAAHGIRERSRRQDAEKLARVIDAHVQMALELQAVFGLRREEAIKFSPVYTDRGDRVRIKASWAKGARGRSRADTRASARYSTSPGTSRGTARCALIPGGAATPLSVRSTRHPGTARVLMYSGLVSAHTRDETLFLRRDKQIGIDGTFPL